MWFFGRRKNKKEKNKEEKNKQEELKQTEKVEEQKTEVEVESKKATTSKPKTKAQGEKQDEKKTAPKTTRKAQTQKVEEKQVEQKQEESTEEAEDRADKKPRTLGKYVVMFDKETQDWKIKRDGAKRIIDSKPTKKAAIERVRELSENNDVGFVAKKKDGKFQKKRNIK